MTVATTERAMHSDWNIQYKNRTSQAPPRIPCCMTR